MMPSNVPETTPEQKEVAKKLLGELNSGSFDAVFTAQEVVSAIKMFVERGEKAEDLMMRADFADDEQATAATRHAAKCADFHDKVGLDELHNTIAARVSIGGKRIDILLKGVTNGNQGAPTQKVNWLKKKAGIE